MKKLKAEDLDLEDVTIEDLTFDLQIFLDKVIDDTPDLGAVTLKCDGREYIIDVIRSNYYDGEDGTVINCDFIKDEDMFFGCEYDLTVEDLFSDDISAEFYIGDDDGQGFKVKEMFLWFAIDGDQFKIKVEEE